MFKQGMASSLRHCLLCLGFSKVCESADANRGLDF